mgnify:CR=1 FL=1
MRELVAIGEGETPLSAVDRLNPAAGRRQRQRSMARWLIPFGFFAGLTFTFCYIVFFKFISPEMDNAQYWWLGVSPEGIGTLGMIFNFIAAVAVASFTKAPPERIQHLVHVLR